MLGQPGLIRSLLAETPSLINAKDEDGRTPLHWAATSNNLGVLQLVLSNSPDIEAQDAVGATPLIVAAAAGQMEAVRELLDAGAKVDSTNEKGQTALHYAASKGNVPVCYQVGFTNAQLGRLLISRGADVSCIHDWHTGVVLTSDQCQGPRFTTSYAPRSINR